MDDAYSKLKLSVNEEEVWYELLDFCLEFISDKNPLEIIRSRPDIKLAQSVLDEIVEWWHFKSNGIPEIGLLTILKEWWKQEDIIQLFLNEKERLLTSESCLQTLAEPVLTWELKNVDNQYYWESEPFYIEDCGWILTVWHFK